MIIEILPDPAAVAERAAALVADEARAAIAARGRFLFAVSGGSTPWRMLESLAGLDLPWDHIHLFQVDERIAPAGDPDRNLTHLEASLLTHAPLGREQIHAMAVEAADLEAAADAYAHALESLGGSPPVLDLIHLGLGSDGHTASLIPGDQVLDEKDRDVAITSRAYQGHHRMTLTYPVLRRARRVLWLVTGASKASVLPRLIGGDRDIPAGRVQNPNALLLTDPAAAADLA